MQESKGQKVKEMEFEYGSGERDLKKKIEIVRQVFKKASHNLTRVDRNWQEVIDSQVYILDELLDQAEQANQSSFPIPRTRKEKG